VGIFAQRGSARPNRLGVTIVRLLGCTGRTLHVNGLDAVDGTPVLDIKPVISELLPRDAVRQPPWASELMRRYWRSEPTRSGARKRREADPSHREILREAPYFPVADVPQVGVYYRDVLGFTCEYEAGNPPEFAVYSRNGSAIMLRRVPDPHLICPNER